MKFFNLRAIERVNFLNCLYLASWIPPSVRILMPLFLHFHTKDRKFLTDNLYFVHVFFNKIGIIHFVYGVVCIYFVHISQFFYFFSFYSISWTNIIRSCEMPHWKVYIFFIKRTKFTFIKYASHPPPCQKLFYFFKK